MATIRKRGNKWQCIVRRRGRTASKSFERRSDAMKWGSAVEAQTDAIGGALPTPASKQADALQLLTLADALRRLVEDMPGERWRLEALARSKVARSRVEALSVEDFSTWRDERLQDAKPSTVVRELSIMQTAIDRVLGDIGRNANPVRHAKRPRIKEQRDRRLTDDEWQRLLRSADRCLNPYLKPILVLARETAMRRGELLSMEWQHVDLGACTVFLPRSKNGHSRLVPLSPTAVEVLRALPHTDACVIPLSANSVRMAWQRLRARAGVEDVRLHDLRAQAATDKLLAGWSVAEVQMLTGHRDAGVLLERYARLRASDIVAKLHASE
ncbi:tyrosine-type recombinase/integrase [Ruegeria arenilitoris]|uniref:tyrosine-type recombinase/integrase n=1 Tax=Ruegeria arenilitoris TaxID=1173585 RepID=UPI00147DA2D2|nr:site-specific integrase [Ruegeria arenilitoris]